MTELKLSKTRYLWRVEVENRKTEKAHKDSRLYVIWV